MLLVKTTIGPSHISGFGLFADEFIPKGTPVWRFQSGFDLKISKDHLHRLPKLTQEFLKKYAYLSKKSGQYIHCGDDGRFFNHSDSPNIIDLDKPDEEEIFSVAAWDIKLGEELTCDYKKFDAGSVHELGF
jgi:uncharacterized protein